MGGTIEERAYLDENREYVVCPSNADMRLRGSTPSADMHAIDRELWMETDPAALPPSLV